MGNAKPTKRLSVTGGVTSSPGKGLTAAGLGGTVGDIESQPLLEAAWLVRYGIGREHVFFPHVSLVPCPGSKSCPTTARPLFGGLVAAAPEYKLNHQNHSNKEHADE